MQTILHLPIILTSLNSKFYIRIRDPQLNSIKPKNGIWTGDSETVRINWLFRPFPGLRFLVTVVDSANERNFWQQLLSFPSYRVQISTLNWGVIPLSMLFAGTIKDYGKISKTSKYGIAWRHHNSNIKEKPISLKCLWFSLPWILVKKFYPENW